MKMDHLEILTTVFQVACLQAQLQQQLQQQQQPPQPPHPTWRMCP